jgi:DNA polymerase elongation subunit (family B)
MKILLLDVETAPNIATVWGLFNQNIGIHSILDSSYMLCWAAKWLGEDDVYFDSIHRSSRKTMVKNIRRLLDEADAVVHYNGKRFDIPTLNKEILLTKQLPPSPYKQVDLLTTVRTQFRFPSNKLQYVCDALGIGSKSKHEGHELWLKCMNGDAEAWANMEEYNIQDVYLLEDLYYKVLPWIKNHPNRSVHSGSMVCPNCGSSKHQKRGYSLSLAGKYQRYRCTDCGSWFRGIKNLADRSKFVTNGV